MVSGEGLVAVEARVQRYEHAADEFKKISKDIDDRLSSIRQFSG